MLRRTLREGERLDASKASQTLLHLSRIGNSGKTIGECSSRFDQFCWESRPHANHLNIRSRLKLQSRGRRGGHALRAISTKKILHPLLLPHLLFAHIYATAKNRFNQLFVGGVGDMAAALEAFWSEVERRNDPRLKDHPMTRKRQWKRRAIPLAIHGDAVPVVAVGKHGTKSLDGIS